MGFRLAKRAGLQQYYFLSRSCKLICVKGLANKTYFSEHSCLTSPHSLYGPSFARNVRGPISYGLLMSSLWKQMRMSDLKLWREWCHTADRRHYRDAKITQAATKLIVMSLFHEKWMRANAQRSLRAVCVCHTLMLYQGSPVSLITQDSFKPWGEGQVNAWTQKIRITPSNAEKEKKKKKKNAACLIWVCSEGKLFNRINWFHEYDGSVC